MIIYPAIDIKDGAIVRLSQGKFDAVTVYGTDPRSRVKSFLEAGAQYIHVVDLDGARDGIRQNAHVIQAIVAEAGNIPVQLGGGIRDMRGIEQAFALGVTRVILGTAAANDTEFLKEALQQYKDTIVVGIDAKDKMVATHGWETVSDISALDLGRRVAQLGAKTIIFTDIATDGMLSGPNYAAMKEMVDATKIDVIASGGVSCSQDVINLKATGVAGVIIGKAIYAGKLDLKQTILENKG